ncbi:MAG: glycosyltransferase [Chitinispirillaceae bacterium]|nr:glycosyltransferase [Chitinispirillaceae bacterium]
MNILFINSIAKHKFGGGEKWMINAAAGLSSAGHKVFLAGKKDSEILRFAEKAGVTTKVLSIHADISPLATWTIARFLRRERIDVLICNLNKDVRVAGLAARLVGTPVVLARHGMLLCGKKWKHRFTLTRLTDGIITNSETIKAAYAGYGWFADDFVKVLYNGVEDKSRVIARDFRPAFGDKKIIVSAGRLAEQKGYGYLLQAACMLLSKRDDLVIVIAGKGKLEAGLKNQARDLGIDSSVRFLGFIEDLDPYLKGCDLFVLASLFEGMPNVVMEAMALGKAVVATDVNGARELMADGTTGLIVPPRDPAALAAAIAALLDDPARRAAFGEAGAARIREHFTIHAMVQHLERFLREKLDEKKSRH